MAQPTIAFIGTGVMGRSMAGHLLAAGHAVHVHTRTPAKAQALLAAGAHGHDTPGAAAAGADFVLSMVGYPSDVEEVYFGPVGVLAAARPGALLIDLTTSSPRLAQRLAAAAAARGLEALDAPVSGGDVGAREARLAIMVGGSEAALARARPILERLGRTIVRLGGPGAGQHCKLANQIAIASGMLAWCEALTYARASGLDPARVLEVAGGGAAASWSLANLAPRALRDDYAPGFFVKHFRKDLRLALEEAAALRLDLPGLRQAQQLYELVAQEGWDDCGTQVLWRYYQARA